MLTIGFIVNPFAGIGGKVGLKGSDGAEIRRMAFERGAIPQALNRCKMTLEMLLPYKKQIRWLTASGDMGESLLKEYGFQYQTIYQGSEPSIAQDTINAASVMIKQHIDLLMFAGGDGTARDIYQALFEQQSLDGSSYERHISETVPVLGIPAGVKIHSGVYAVTPTAAGRVVEQILSNKLVSLVESSVMDIDEDAFRQGSVRAKQYGEMRVPAEHRYIQATKSGSTGKESEVLALTDIAEFIIDEMEDDYHYLIGSGTSCAAIMEFLQLPNSLLGIDWVHNKQLAASDLHEKHILELLEKYPNRVKVVITIIGGQGHIIGRGNHQLSAAVLAKLGKDNLVIIATKTKLSGLNGKPLIMDSDDFTINQTFAGPICVITGYQDSVLYPVGLADELTD